MTAHSVTSLLFSAFIGFMANLLLDWQSWQKLSGRPHSLWQYIREDQAAFSLAVVLAVASYIALPELGAISWFQRTLGFAPQRTPMGAMAAAFVFCQMGYQLREFFLRGTGK